MVTSIVEYFPTKGAAGLRMEATGLVYVRFMDDCVILVPTRWKLRMAVQRRASCVRKAKSRLYRR